MDCTPSPCREHHYGIETRTALSHKHSGTHQTDSLSMCLLELDTQSMNSPTLIACCHVPLSRLHTPASGYPISFCNSISVCVQTRIVHRESPKPQFVKGLQGTMFFLPLPLEKTVETLEMLIFVQETGYHVFA